MYTPRAFIETDLAELDRLIARDAFVTLVTTGSDGLPWASHLPVLYSRNGNGILIEGHWARPNPQAGHAEPALMIVHGPHAYVSPGWYPDKSAGSGFGQPKAGTEGEPHGRGGHKEEASHVPTWNYSVAHLYGKLHATEDTATLASIVDRLSQVNEARVGNDWRFEHDHPGHARQLKGIIGFGFVPDRVELKAKFNQNHPAANVRGAADGLKRLDDPLAHQVADEMLDRLARHTSPEE